MGQEYTIKCPHCGKKFKWSLGFGDLNIEVLHCTKCGKKKEWNRHDMVTDGDLDCPCGGMFSDDAPIRCPKCKKEIEDVDSCLVEVMCWD